MKARVKATGEIVDVNECGQTFKDMKMDYMDMRGRCYRSEDLDFTDNTPLDYWTRLEHQYAGMAMQGILSNPEYLRSLIHTKHDDYSVHEIVPDFAVRLSHALVEKYKKEERK